MPSADELNQLKNLMAQVFPGYEAFCIDSVTPSVTGDSSVVSFMIVCNEEASRDFTEYNDISAEVVASVDENKRGNGKDLTLRFEFSFPVFSLQFFTTIEGENYGQQKEFVRVLSSIDFFIIWLVDKEKNLLKVLQVEWDKEGHKEILMKLGECLR